MEHWHEAPLEHKCLWQGEVQGGSMRGEEQLLKASALKGVKLTMFGYTTATF